MESPTKKILRKKKGSTKAKVTPKAKTESKRAPKSKSNTRKKKPVQSRPNRGVKSKITEPKVGRRGTLTDQIQKDLVTVIGAGNYYVTACNYVGIPQSTFYLWLKRGEDESDRLLEIEKETGKMESPKETELIYLEFVETIKKADAGAEISALLKVKSAYGDSWQAAMTFLERRHSDRWRRKERLELAGDEDSPVQVRLYLPRNGRDESNEDDD